MKRLSLAFIISTLFLFAACGKEDPTAHLDALQSENTAQRIEAAAALGNFAGDEVIDALINALDDPDPRVARRALLSLVKIGGAAVPQLAGALKEGPLWYPILEFDEEMSAVIEPQFFLKTDLGTNSAVFCFFPEVIEKLERDGTLSIAATFGGESGLHKVYLLERDGKKVAVIHPGVGAPLAVARMERLIVGNIERIIAVGGAGALNEDIKLGDIVLPTEAIRDEGTSYHYLKAGEAATTSEALRNGIAELLDEREISYRTGKVWTTDAIFRETRNRVDRRRSEGALLVEMECASFCAVAQFRGIEFAQILYGADDLSGEEWDNRNWRNATELREGLFWLAVDALTAE